jgi:hypothetical protein
MKVTEFSSPVSSSQKPTLSPSEEPIHWLAKHVQGEAAGPNVQQKCYRE